MVGELRTIGRPRDEEVTIGDADEDRYIQRRKKARSKTGQDEACCIVAVVGLDSRKSAATAHKVYFDFDFFRQVVQVADGSVVNPLKIDLPALEVRARREAHDAPVINRIGDHDAGREWPTHDVRNRIKDLIRHQAWTKETLPFRPGEVPTGHRLLVAFHRHGKEVQDCPFPILYREQLHFRVDVVEIHYRGLDRDRRVARSCRCRYLPIFMMHELEDVVAKRPHAIPTSGCGPLHDERSCADSVSF